MSWSKLSESHPLIATLITEWQLLLRGNHPERVYHDFLKKHANLFLVDGQNTYFAISKLKLGSEIELDFAVPSEDHSRGLFWELIEIKRPQVAPFTKSGVPSAILTEATQQIRDWKYWIQTSRSEAMKLFSLWKVRTVRKPNFRYTIVIGNRQNSEKWLNQRNQYAEENGIRVRSFDYLTDRIRRRVYLDKAFVGSSDWDDRHPDLCKELANPFIEALTDSQWKKLLREPDVSGPHFIANSCKRLLAHWTPNVEYLSRFNDELRLKAQQINSADAKGRAAD